MRFPGALMMSVAGAAVLAGLLAAQSPSAKGPIRPKRDEDPEPVPGYKHRQLCGFQLLINRTVMEEQEKSTDRRKPLDVLELELDMLGRDLPPRNMAVLRTIPLWVEWDEGEQKVVGDRVSTTVAKYHAGSKPGKLYRFPTLERAVKSNCVEIVSMKTLTKLHQGDKQECVLLHEIAHAVHHHVFDYDNPVIKRAYQEAMAKHLYDNRYAATNECEYFAELSCAYFGHLTYKPETREELKTYDPIGYRMMELTWGTPEEIERAQKPEREKAAAARLLAARRMMQNKSRKDEAIAALESLTQDYPNTKAGIEGAKLLAKLKQ